MLVFAESQGAAGSPSRTVSNCRAGRNKTHTTVFEKACVFGTFPAVLRELKNKFLKLYNPFTFLLSFILPPYSSSRSIITSLALAWVIPPEMISEPLNLLWFFTSIHSKCTPLKQQEQSILLSFLGPFLNWVETVKRKSTNQPFQSFVFIKHKGAQTKSLLRLETVEMSIRKKKKSSLGLLLKLTVPLNHLNHLCCSLLKGSRFLFLSPLLLFFQS